MEQFLSNQQIPLVQVIDPNTGQQYYVPAATEYNDRNGPNPTILKSVVVNQAASASYFSGSITNAIYAQTASYVDKPIVSASYASTASYFSGSVTNATYAVSASYAATASTSITSQNILVYVKNQSGNTIAKGVVVRITGSNNSSDIPRIVTASYENDNNSANTLGITNQSISNGSEGYVMTEGVLLGIDTTNFDSGQLIYLGPTGSIIGYAPVAPLHAVRLGEVIRQQSNNGSIYVRIDNGYELSELHDVLINTGSVTSGDLLIRSASVWINSKQLTGSYSVTGSFTVSGSSTFTNIGPAIFSGSITSTGGFTGSFQGTSSFSFTASYATQAGNTNTININSFGSPVESYLLMSNVIATPGVAIGGDTDLRYNSSTNVLTVPNISATALTGSLLGTASYAATALTASYALQTLSASFASTASYVQTSQTASYVLNAISASYARTASYVQNAISASYATNALSASYYGGSVTSASYATTTSYVNPLIQNVIITGSLTSTATVQANKFVFANSVINQNSLGQNVYATDSNILYLYTGTGGLYVNNQANSAINVLITDTGAVTTRGSITAGSPGNDQSIYFGGTNAGLYWASSGASIFYSVGALQFSSVGSTNNMILQMNGGALFNYGITGSLQGTSSFSLNSTSASFASTASYYGGNVTSASYSTTASYIKNAQTASYYGGSVTSASFATTASYVLNAISSSYSANSDRAVTASYSATSISASFALTSSYVNALNQNVLITGSLTVGSSSFGPVENTLTLGARDNGSEGGQLGLNAPGGTYTSSSFLDNWQNKLRLLKGTNAGSTAEVASWDLQTLYMTLPGGAITMPARPAFRVTGSSGYNPAVNTVLSGSGIGIDYNQGSYYNNTNGQFTCPVAGLYHVWYVGRTFNASLASVALYKNGGGVPLAFWESNINSGHFGVSAIVNMAVNDVITAKVTAGQVTFYGNDNWGVAYVG